MTARRRDHYYNSFPDEEAHYTYYMYINNMFRNSINSRKKNQNYQY